MDEGGEGERGAGEGIRAVGDLRGNWGIFPFDFSADVDGDLGICFEGDPGGVGILRRALVNVFSVGLRGEGLMPFRNETPLISLGLLGGVEGPERTGDGGTTGTGCPSSSFGDGGSIETARNVSNSLAFITFSSPVCEWSGKLAINGATEVGIVEPGKPVGVWAETLSEEVMELVRGLCPLTVGAEPE